jgi:hypothetical protein
MYWFQLSIVLFVWASVMWGMIQRLDEGPHILLWIALWTFAVTVAWGAHRRVKETAVKLETSLRDFHETRKRSEVSDVLLRDPPGGDRVVQSEHDVLGRREGDGPPRDPGGKD